MARLRIAAGRAACAALAVSCAASLATAPRSLAATPIAAAGARTLALRARPARLLTLLRAALARRDGIPIRPERRSGGLETFDHHTLDAVLEQALDVPQEIAFFGAYQRYGLA